MLSKDQEHAAVILLSAGAGRISLAGGAALIVHGLVDRPTQDLDAFSEPKTDVTRIVSRVQSAFTAAGYTVEDISGSELRTFLVSRRKRGRLGRPIPPVKIQIGRDYQLLKPVTTRMGPALDPIELGANKILTVYDRPRGRDADDLARIIPHLGFQRLLDAADRKQTDPLDRRQLAHAFRLLQRLGDREFPYPKMAGTVRDYMGSIAHAVEQGETLTPRSPYAQAVAKPHTTGRPADRPSQRRPTTSASASAPGGICGAPTHRGTPCQNPAGSCPHH